MSRTRRHVSRALIGVLAVTLVLGLVSWINRQSSTRAAPASSAPPAPAALPTDPVIAAAPAVPGPVDVAPTAPQANPQDDYLVLETPTTRPATLPAPARQFAAAGPRQQDNAVAGRGISIDLSKKPSNSAADKALSANPIADAKAAVEADRMLEARDALAAALRSGKLSPGDEKDAKRLLGEVNQSVIFSTRRYPSDPLGGNYLVKPGDRLQRIAQQHDLTWELLGRINGLSDPRKLRSGVNLKVIQGPFHALVDKSDFTLDIYLGGTPSDASAMFVRSFRVGLGENDSTPTGTWIVEQGKKIKNPVYYSPRGEGVIDANDPKNPLGEFWIGLAGIDGEAVGKDSYGIHGTIEPQSIGRQASMGCIRLLNEDVALVYELLVEGQSTVTVRD